MKQDMEHIFTYHSPKDGDQEKYSKIRAAARRLAEIIQEEVPAGADQADAIRKVREAVMTANAGVALGGRLNEVSQDVTWGGQLGQ